MFRPSDVRRVQKAYDNVLPGPYEATVLVTNQRTVLDVIIEDPDDESLRVVTSRWVYDLAALKGTEQPRNDEIEQMALAAANLCMDYPERKARDEIENAEREARQVAQAAARAAEAELEAEAAALADAAKE